MTLNEKLEYEKSIIEISEKRFNEFYSFIRQVVIICTTILGVIISLKQNKTTNCVEFYSFVSVTGMLSLCILIGVVLLFGRLRAYDNQIRVLHKHLNKRLSGEEIDSTSIYVPTDKIFVLFEKAFYLIFVISILCIFLYSVLLIS